MLIIDIAQIIIKGNIIDSLSFGKAKGATTKIKKKNKIKLYRLLKQLFLKKVSKIEKKII